MDSRGTWPPPSSHSQRQQPPPGMLTSPNPFLLNPNPNPAAIMMGGGSTSTSQSSSHHRLPFGALSLPNQHRQPQRTLGSIVFGDGPHFQSQQVEKRRPGRPRKFSDEHYIVSPLLSVTDSYGGGNNNSNGGDNANSSDQPAKRGRGRPRGAKRQQLEALGKEGIGFTPHVVKVKTGEDIATKLREFSEQGPRTISILSGTGTVGKVTLRHSSSVTATYEGQYEIVTLAVSFLNCEVDGRMSRICSLNVALAGNDGRVIGGGVIGALVAATDVQVVVVSFLVEPKKQKKSKSSQPEGSSGQANVNNPFASPRSQGPSCDSTGNNESSSHPLQSPNNMSSSNRGTSSRHSAPQQHHQQHRQQQEQQQRQEQEQQRQQLQQ